MIDFSIKGGGGGHTQCMPPPPFCSARGLHVVNWSFKYGEVVSWCTFFLCVHIFVKYFYTRGGGGGQKANHSADVPSIKL